MKKAILILSIVWLLLGGICILYIHMVSNALGEAFGNLEGFGINYLYSMETSYKNNEQNRHTPSPLHSPICPAKRHPHLPSFFILVSKLSINALYSFQLAGCKSEPSYLYSAMPSLSEERVSRAHLIS